MARKLAEKLIEIDLSGFLAVDDPNPFFQAILDKLREKIPEAVISNLCKYCQPAMTKAVNKYVNRFVVSAVSGGILAHPNFNLEKAPKDYLGALGIPKRYNRKTLLKYLRRAVRVDVQACGAQASRTLIKAARRTKGGAEALRTFTKQSAPSTITTLKLDEITKLAYKETGFRAGVDGKYRTKTDDRGSYKRLWLKEADTGETDVSGWDVFPGKGEGLGNFRGTNKSSRSGTHIMIRSEKSYDPNEWRPSPGENFIIKSVFLSKIPGMQNAAIRAAIDCIKKRKRQISDSTQKAVTKGISTSKKISTASIQGDVGSDQRGERSGGESAEDVAFRNEARANPIGLLKDFSLKLGLGIAQTRALAEAQASAKGLSLGDYLFQILRS